MGEPMKAGLLFQMTVRHTPKQRMEDFPGSGTWMSCRFLEPAQSPFCGPAAHSLVPFGAQSEDSGVLALRRAWSTGSPNLQASKLKWEKCVTQLYDRPKEKGTGSPKHRILPHTLGQQSANNVLRVPTHTSSLCGWVIPDTSFNFSKLSVFSFV